MISGSPLSKDWKEKKGDVKIIKPPKIIGKGECKKIVKRSCDSQQCGWVDRWLKNLVQSRSLPPQCAGCEAHSFLYKYMGEAEAEKIIAEVQKEFNQIYPPLSTA
jgi:hypothetical protein